jgi:hypothetical protein
MYVISKKLRGGSSAAAAEEVTTALYLILDGYVFQCASLASVVHARACQMGHFSREALDAVERSSSWDPFEGTISKSNRACTCEALHVCVFVCV